MTNYRIIQDGGYYCDKENLQDAIDLAETLLGGVFEPDESTFTVEGEGGKLMASLTNRHIVGVFTKQKWGGRKNDDAIFIGEEEFYATNSILSLSHEDLMKLTDNSESSDNIGRNSVDWPGPFEVKVVNSVCAYFGVADIEDITPEAFEFAVQRANPQPIVAQTITLSVKVALRVTPGSSVSSFVENMDYSVVSNTVGIVVTGTEIIEAQ